jgi:uroporphyrinogen decarboxylase
MNKRQRVEAVLAGRPVDHPPISFWYHFGLQHLPGERHARATLDFFHHYDLDFLKVMNDYFYPPPEGLDAVKSRADLEKIHIFDVEDSPWREQFKALDVIARELDGQAVFLDTVFDPFQTLRRNMAGENIEMLMETEPQAVRDALEIISDNLIAYCKRSLAIGAAGIFMSIPAGRELISRERFRTFVKPFARRVFEAIRRDAPMNTLHIHGDEDLFMAECLDFPVAVFNWWDRGPTGPALAAVKKRTGACVMGGVDHVRVARATPAHMKTHVREALELGGDARFFLANGCSIDAWTCPDTLHAMVRTSREGR